MIRHLNSDIYLWLFLNCLMIIIMVVIGGTTRLTESGLSMIDWNLFKGILPPLNEKDWLKLFNDYKNYPEYKLINFDITIYEFKKIFFWEYVHRIWGRLIGLTFLIPFFYFLLKRRFSIGLIKFLLPILFLGCFQGFMGWYMVESGLSDRPDVSQYRLASHLIIAFIIYVLLLFLTWNQYRSNMIRKSKNTKVHFSPFSLCFFLTLITVISGAFVAGTDAGLAYNNFPMMGDSFFPPDPFLIEPFWKNFFENVGLVQFDHRLLATITATIILIVSFSYYKKYKKSMTGILIGTLILLITLQYVLGIITLKLYVPIALGVIHQLGSLAILTILTLILSEFYTIKKGVIK